MGADRWQVVSSNRQALIFYTGSNGASVEKNNPDPEIQALLEQAERLLDEQRYEESAGVYRRVCQQNPENAMAWTGWAITLLHQRCYPECFQAISNALALEASLPRPYLIAASALTGMGRYGEALRAVDAALTLAPDSLKGLNSKAGILLNQRHYQEALTWVERALQLEPDNVHALLNRGVALHGLEQPLAALAAFDHLLMIDPRHPDALMNRSSLLIALNRAEEALQAADAALMVRPDAAVALLNRAAALLRLQRPREALAAAERLLQQNSRHIKGLINKTLALLALWDFPEALATIQKVLTLDSYNPDALELKLRTLAGLKRFREMAAEARAALSRHPNRLTLKLEWVRALIGDGRRDEAEAQVDAILATMAHPPEAVLLKSEILLSRGERDAGLALIEQALAKQSGNASLWSAKSALLLATGQYEAALSAAERAIALESDHVQAAINRVAALNGLNRFAEALSATQKLLEQGVRDWQVYANHGGALAGLERFDEARQAFATARDLDPSAFRAFRTRHEIHGVAPDALLPEIDPRAESLALRLERLERGDWREYATILERATALIEQSLAEGQLAPVPPFKTLSLPFPPALNLAVARSRGDFLSSGTQALRQQLAFSDPAPGAERLRIGYVSADFRQHPTAHLMRSLFRVHDRNRFTVYVYALCRDDGSAYYQQIKADADQFVDLTGLSNVEAATRIHADGIHVLVDLMGYTAYARSEIFALQPAPVQVSYLGYPGTLGLPSIPYILADPVVLPEALLPFFTEQPVYLPECYQVNDRWQTIAETGVQRREVGLPETGFVFCCFNQPAKLDPLMFQVWMRILNQVAGSVLWLLASDPEVAGRLRREAESCGVAGERLIFAERLPKGRHLERHRLADLFLDTRLYNAHTTASDALWAGLPVLTCIGESFPARVAASLLQTVGLPELITHSLEEYEQLAVRLATQPELLAALRAKLADLRLRTPLFDTERFARHLERAFEMMWERHVQGLLPAPLRVAPLDER